MNRSLLVSLKRMPAALALIFINITVFVITCLIAGSPDSPDWTSTLLRMGAQFNPLTLDREWYRMVTHIFLHGSVVHLVVNMYVLIYAGYAIEVKVGTKKFVFLFFVCALAAALNSLYWNLFTIDVGTSGALSGLLGFSLVRNIFSGNNGKSMILLLGHFGLFVVINLLIPARMHPDYAGQFGGVLAGILIGFISFAKGGSVGFSKVRIEYLLIVLLIGWFFMLPRFQVRYFKFFKQVVEAEDTTQHLLKEKLTDDDMRTFIRNYHHWDEVLTRLQEQTNLPPTLATDTFKLRNYISLRKKENVFKKTVVQQEAYIYLDSVEHLHRIIQEFMDLDYGLWSRIKAIPELIDSSSMSLTRVLYDSNWTEIATPPAAYYRVGFRDSLGRWDGAVREYYGNGAVRMKGSYSKNKRDGVFLFYSDHKTHMSAGRYVDNKPFGKWETFHDNGKLAAEIFHNGEPFVKNVWDSVGNRLVVDGNGREIQRYPNGVIAIEGEYRHGAKEGYWYGRHPNGELYFEETFQGGRLVNGKSRTLKGETFVYDESSMFPMPAGGFERFYAYVKEEAKKFDTDELGHVKVSFMVTRNGVLTEVNIDQSATPALDAKALDILLKGPRWLPARDHGHEPVDETGLVQIEFY
ncbi:MAG: rhomboid family intramembrane serine protease [Chryseosolibacter sp.]